LDDAEGNRHGDEGTDKRADYRQAPPISSAELHTLPPLFALLVWILE
jgi:hypothetical protein